MTGKVVRVIAEKGFGFIRAKENEVEYFFHHSGYNGHWIDLVNDFDKRVIIVEFEEVGSNKGPRAENVTRI